MPAVVKARSEPGLELQEVPVPEVGPNDVRIRVQKASICGTDVHIYNWDAWAQKTIPVPLVIGHEFVGVVDQVGSAVTDFKEGELVTTEGHIVCGHCRNCLAGRRHLCPNTNGIGVQSPGRLRGIRCRSLQEHLALRSEHPARCHFVLRPARECGPHRVVIRPRGRRRAHHRRRTDRLHGGADRKNGWRAESRDHRRQPLPARDCAEDGRHARHRCARNETAGRDARSRDEGGIRRRAGDVGQRRRRSPTCST